MACAGRSDAGAAQPGSAPAAGRIGTVRRPVLEDVVYRDEDGVVLAYGRRWKGGETPEDSYERISHPERLDSLAQVVHALAAHLEVAYEVRREVTEMEDGTCINLVPADPLAASLRLEPKVEGGHFAVRIFAGAAHDFVVPACGCDACDEAVQGAAGELEILLLGVAAGGFAERIYDLGGQTWIQFRLVEPDGNSSRGGEALAGPHAELEEARTRLELVAGDRHPWPLRAST